MLKNVEKMLKDFDESLDGQASVKIKVIGYLLAKQEII